ncbi:hypothetical protein KM1_085440 [Entamoeba histolytica HM-3:IMSS]|nr:hypothetical protein KM1_085440 [Entamoeba histolytica HM-3:IMSS]
MLFKESIFKVKRRIIIERIKTVLKTSKWCFNFHLIFGSFMSDKKKRGFKNEPTDTSSSSNLVYDKQFCEIFKKNVLNLVNDLKTLKETMKTAESLIHSINDQISSIYSTDGDSIIQDEV